MNISSFRLRCGCLPVASAETPSLRGTITDPSGAAIPGAVVQLRGQGGEHRTKTDRSGQYAFATLPSGHYEVRVSAKHFSIALKEVNITAKDFSIALKKDLLIDRPAVFDVQLVIKGEKQVIDVDDQVHRVGPEPDANGDSLI